MSDPSVNLSNCASEPIHIPGAIQPHGALLAFDRDLRLACWSTNLDQFLDVQAHRGMAPEQLLSEPRLLDLLYASAQAEGIAGHARAELSDRDGTIDCVTHNNGRYIVLELERRHANAGDVGASVLQAYVVIERIKHLRSIEQMLQFAVEQVRTLTGFDRVMAYRFRHDDSGDVVAEATAPGMPPYLGQRYPASDIPPQARRLYTLNTLRSIADVHYAPVAMVGEDPGAPFDMSHSVLRSVSPIHLEYLKNMGVGASMSISLVINGKLWGLIACHHRGAHHPGYPVRLACDVLSQVVAAQVVTIGAHAAADYAKRAADLRGRLIETLHRDEDVLAALHEHREELAQILGGQGLIVSYYGKHIVHGLVEPALAASIIASLPAEAKLVERNCRDNWPADLQQTLGTWVGALALNFDGAAGGWIVALRTEQVEQVRWGGKPAKSLTIGPLGPRLTPRGSFDTWVETVTDCAEPWSDAIRDLTEQLQGELRRVCMRRHADTEQARMQLLAMLGHDLRTPLQSIAMTASLLKHGNPDDVHGGRLERSSGRMKRLISQVMDLSRLEHGQQIDLRKRPVLLREMLKDLVDEALGGHPGTAYVIDAPDDVAADADPDQLAQVLSNLLSNARHYGTPGLPIELRLARTGSGPTIQVLNHSAPIPAAIEKVLFMPFKPRPPGQAGNQSGLGIGLYISHAITAAHGGTLGYRYVDGKVEFTVTLPAAADH